MASCHHSNRLYLGTRRGAGVSANEFRAGREVRRKGLFASWRGVSRLPAVMLCNALRAQRSTAQNGRHQQEH